MIECEEDYIIEDDLSLYCQNLEKMPNVNRNIADMIIGVKNGIDKNLMQAYQVKDYKEISNILQDRNYFTKYAKEAIIYFGTYSCYSNKN